MTVKVPTIVYRCIYVLCAIAVTSLILLHCT